MREIDRKLAEALRADDESLFDVHAGEQSLFEQVADTFRGRRRWMVAMVWFWSFVVFGVAVYAAVRFFQADTDRGMIGWGLGFVMAMIGVSMLKSWYFMEMNRNAVLREIKRVELQIARLAEKIDGV